VPKQAVVKAEAPADDKTDDKQPASPEEDKVDEEKEQKYLHFFCELPRLQSVSS
jgi:hypothetical protein